MPIDLHCHTYYSDGKFAPEVVIHAAHERGITTLAITDHDNTRGARLAAPLARAARIELIPGIEITTRWPGAHLPPVDANVDLLGYYIHWHDPVFQAFETALLNDIQDRVREAVEQIAAGGHPIQFKDVLDENPRYGGTLQALRVLSRKGIGQNWAETARIFDACWLAIRETPFTIRAAIEQIHLAGGVAVLAHPSIVRPEGQPLTAAHLAQLVDWGLDGIEIYHHRLDPAARTYFLGLANQFKLLVTGGSDMHGWSRGLDDLGSQPVTKEMVDRLREKAAAH